MGILEQYNEQIGKLVTFLGISKYETIRSAVRKCDQYRRPLLSFTAEYVEADGLTADQITLRQAHAQKYATKQLWLVIKAIVAQRSMVIGILANISSLQWGLQAGIICTLVGFLFLALSIVYEASIRVGVAQWDQLHVV